MAQQGFPGGGYTAGLGGPPVQDLNDPMQGGVDAIRKAMQDRYGALQQQGRSTFSGQPYGGTGMAQGADPMQYWRALMGMGQQQPPPVPAAQGGGSSPLGPAMPPAQPAANPYNNGGRPITEGFIADSFNPSVPSVSGTRTRNAPDANPYASGASSIPGAAYTGGQGARNDPRMFGRYIP